MANDNQTNTIIQKMLESRENYARGQDKDYSNVFRKKSYFEVLRLTAFGMGIGFVFGTGSAHMSPMLLQIGLDYSTMTMVGGLSPALGLLLGPLIGCMSDQCRLSMGRRRPVILLLSLGMVISLILVPYGRNIGQFFNDGSSDMIPLSGRNITESIQENTTTLPTQYKPNLKFAVIFTVVGTTLVDFIAQTCQSPARAYALDVCIPQDHGRALSTFSVMVGVGSIMGYAVGGVDWEAIPLTRFLGGNIQTVFMIATIFFAVCLPITIFSFREIPLPLIEKDEMLRPLTAAAIKNECLKATNSKPDDLTIKDVFKIPVCHGPSFEIDNVEEEIIETVTLGRYLKSIVVMPSSMWILSLTNLISWMGHICYILYFTDFVGEAVFHGDPAAPAESERYKLYDAGVRFGCWGMALFSFSATVYSFIIERLIIWFKPKHVYIFGIMVFAISMFILAAWPSKLGVLVLSIAAGLTNATMFTVPYIIVANYHSKNCFKVCNGKSIPLTEPRGLGTDLAIICSMIFLAQLLMALSIGYLVTWSGTTSAIFYASSGISVCAAVSAMFVLYI